MSGGKRSNGEGGIVYDKRRKTYRARITVGWEIDELTGKTKQIMKSLGSFKTKGEAAGALADYLRNPYDLSNKNITFKELYETWFDQYVEDHESHRYRIKSAFNYCSMIYDKKFREITILDMKNCMTNGEVICKKGKNKGLPQKPSASVKMAMKYLFNHLYDYAVEGRIVETNYARAFAVDQKISKEIEQNKKEKIPFTKEELQTLWDSIKYVPFADMVVYACYSGWRPGELIELKVDDVDWDNKMIKGGIKTTAGKNRIVPIHPLVEDIVRKYYDEAKTIGSQYLFNDAPKKTGKGLSYDQYLTRFGNVLYLTKLRKEITPHYTRHTFITKAKSLDVGMNEYILKLIVGHEVGDLTEHVYTHREISELTNEMLKIKE